MDKSKYIDKLDHPMYDVALFHSLVGQPVNTEVVGLSPLRQELRRKLSEEELKEFHDAVDAGDIIEQADALGDRMYVLVGDIIECGMGEVFPAIFAEVQRSNMTKLCNTIEEVDDTMNHYLEKGERSKCNTSGQPPYAVYRRDGKLLKSINYSPANIKKVLEDYTKSLKDD